jgi:hypothetical protein
MLRAGDRSVLPGNYKHKGRKPMRKQLFFSTVAALALGGQVLAGDISYNYVQADLQASRISDDDYDEHENGLGYALHGSAELGSHLLALLDISSTKYDFGVDVRYTYTTLGLGVHAPVTSAVDFVGAASFERVKFKVTSYGSDTPNGWGLGAGVRGIAHKVQWNTMLKYRYIDETGLWSIAAGARYYVLSYLAAGVELAAQRFEGGTIETFTAVTLRYDFGSRR